MNPRVKTVKPLKGYKLELSFSDNSHGIFDCNQYLNIGVFRELKNISYFNKVKAVAGTVAWPHGQDFCPDTVYEESKLLV